MKTDVKISWQVTLICISSRKVEAIQESFSDLKAIFITDLDDLRFLGLLIRLNFSLCEKLLRRSLDLNSQIGLL